MLTFNPLAPQRVHEGRWWIDDGHWFPIDPEDADENPNSPFHPDNPGLPFGELRLVRFERRDGAVTIAWDVDEVEPTSLAAARALVSPGFCDRVTLRFNKHGWAEESYLSPDEAAVRLARLANYRGVPLLAPTLVSPRPIEETEQADPLIAEAFDSWRMHGSMQRFLSGDLGAGALLYERSIDDGLLLFRHVGAQSEIRRMLGDEWAAGALGSPCDAAFADRAFDRRVSACYRSVLESRTPRFDHVRGLIDLGPFAIWVLYQRLLLPFESQVACMAKVTPEVRVPFFEGQNAS